MAEVVDGTTQSAKVQLGCGTLILIAIIVMIFSGSNDVDDAREEIEALSAQLARVEAKLDSLSRQLETRAAP
jgi:hypothetical protein